MFPAARVLDSVTHDLLVPSGVIGPPVTGPCPLGPVLIEGLPAAHVACTVTCTGAISGGLAHPPIPGPPPPVAMGSATVLIHGMPASRWTPSGDLSACCAFLGMPALAATRTVFIGGPGAQLLPFAPLLLPQESLLSCGPAAARMVIASETGRLIPESQLRQQSQKYPGGYDPVNGTDMSNLAILLQENGVSDVQMHDDLSIDELQAATAGGHPAIAHCVNEDGSGHFVVVDAVRDNPDGTRTVSVRDPWRPGEGDQYQLSEAEFDDYHSGGAITTNP